MSDKPHNRVCASSGGIKRYRSETDSEEEAQEQRETEGFILASGELATGRSSAKRIKLVGSMTTSTWYYQFTPCSPFDPMAGSGLIGNNGDCSTPATNPPTSPTHLPTSPTHPPTSLRLSTADRVEEEQDSVQASNNGTPEEFVCPQVDKVVTPGELVCPSEHLLMSKRDQNCP